MNPVDVGAFTVEIVDVTVVDAGDGVGVGKFPENDTGGNLVNGGAKR